jgi:hypothetical protein
MMAQYVFISYSRKDRSFVKKLNDILHTFGLQTWTDLENILPGQQWAKVIKDALEDATALIYVASKHSRNSSWIEKEIEIFIKQKSRIIPIIIDEEGIENLPSHLKEIQWIDFRNQFQSALHSLISSLERLGFKISSPLPSTPAKVKGYVFISYADEDSMFVEKLKSFLTNHNYAYWDYRESNRNYQSDYTLELESIIKEASATLSIISPEWKRSRDALREFHFSEKVGTPVFLIIIRDPGPTLLIAGMTYIDFKENQQNGFLKLDAEMKKRGL